MKVVISSTEHSVDVEVADDLPELDVHEVMAMVRDLYRETKPATSGQMGFGRVMDGQ